MFLVRVSGAESGSCPSCLKPIGSGLSYTRKLQKDTKDKNKKQASKQTENSSSDKATNSQQVYGGKMFTITNHQGNTN